MRKEARIWWNDLPSYDQDSIIEEAYESNKIEVWEI